MVEERLKQVVGFVRGIVEEPGLTLAEAKKKAQCNPEKYKCGSVESVVFESWEEDLVKTEDDE